MRVCEFCESSLQDDRPYSYCMAKDCVQQGLYYRRAKIALVLVPKQGFAFVLRDNIPSGKSSGR